MRPPGLLNIIHISDIHFTRNDPAIKNDHIFDPERTAAGDQPGRAGWPEIWEMLAHDLDTGDRDIPVLICVSGDLTHTAHDDEYRRAKKLIRHLADEPVLGKARGLASIFIVPGNHDVLFREPDQKKRSENFIEFHNDVLQTKLKADDPYSVAGLHELKEHRTLLLCLHSAIWVREGSPDQDRGNIDPNQFKKVKSDLQAIPPETLRRSIKIAMIHHHPVLIPPLVEKGYDAVHNSGQLINLLREFGFHIVLHGHKHYPYNFSYDARSAFHAPEPTAPDGSGRLFIIGGGSIGSRSIPDLGTKGNCYNRITVRWNPEYHHFRAKVETRRLNTRDKSNNPLLPNDWTWSTLDVDDRSYSQSRLADEGLPPVKNPVTVPLSHVISDEEQSLRSEEYQRTHGNMPVVEVRPSLVRGQDRYFEARVWIVSHNRSQVPKRVVWSAGKKFRNAVVVEREQDENFSASFYYYGGMLIQGRLEFDEGAPALVYVYARQPVS